MKATCLEKYGTENVWNSGAIGRKNADQTKLERYGDANFNNRAKARQTCMTKLAVDNAIKSPEVAAKARASLMKTFYSERLLKHPFVKPLFSADEYAARSKETLLKWKCLKCSAEFEATCNWNFRKDYTSVKSVARCPVCFPLHVSTSAEEKELAAFIKSCYPGQVLENWRGLTEDGKSQAHSKEIDIYLPELKLGFEYDGLYWH